MMLSEERKSPPQVGEGHKMEVMEHNAYLENTSEKLSCQAVMDDFKQANRHLDEPKVLPSKEPIPLAPNRRASNPYPTQALGSFSRVVETIATGVQCSPAMAAGSVLAILAVIAQAHKSIQFNGSTTPLSLYFLTVAESGDRKTTTDKLASKAIIDCEKSLFPDYEKKLKVYYDLLDAHNATKASINKKNTLSYSEKVEKIKALGLPPKKPSSPTIMVANLNIEGLYRELQEGRPAKGIFSDEAGSLFGGTAFQKENQLKTISCLSSLWSGTPVDKLRKGEGYSKLYNRRCSAHLMVQPTIASMIFSDKLMTEQGFLPRFLIGWPETLRGTRLYCDSNLDKSEVLQEYNERITHLLKIRLPINERNELETTDMLISAEAKECWKGFYNYVEIELGKNKSLASIPEAGSRIAEQALRLAGVLQFAENPVQNIVEPEIMKNGILLAEWYLNEILNINEESSLPKDIIKAQKLLDWLMSRGKTEVTST